MNNIFLKHPLHNTRVEPSRRYLYVHLGTIVEEGTPDPVMVIGRVLTDNELCTIYSTFRITTSLMRQALECGDFEMRKDLPLMVSSYDDARQIMSNASAAYTKDKDAPFTMNRHLICAPLPEPDPLNDLERFDDVSFEVARRDKSVHSPKVTEESWWESFKRRHFT